MHLQIPDNTITIGERPLIMGILNVTPDSFSDGGKFVTQEAIVRQVDKMVTDGADIIDVGGESTRPYAAAVTIAEELARVIPAIDIIRKHHKLPISIDTSKSEVAAEALAAGADIINDISALRFDPAMIDIAIQHNAPVVLMHMHGTPRDMQINPTYDNVIEDILSFFAGRLAWAQKRGLKKEKIIIDPGIGFGKTVEHNLSILKHLDRFQTLGCPVLVGHSRKSFLAKILQDNIEDRDMPTAALSMLCALKGAAILRVHDVALTARTLRLAAALRAVP